MPCGEGAYHRRREYSQNQRQRSLLLVRYKFSPSELVDLLSSPRPALNLNTVKIVEPDSCRAHSSRRKFTWTVIFDALFTYGCAYLLRLHARYLASSLRPENLITFNGLVRIVGFWMSSGAFPSRPSTTITPFETLKRNFP